MAGQGTNGGRNRLFEFWPSLWASRDFEAEFLGRFGRPCFISKRRAAIDAPTDGREFSVWLRSLPRKQVRAKCPLWVRVPRLPLY